MAVSRTLKQIQGRVVTCERCPELRTYCEKVAREKRRAYANEDYWGKPVPAFGDHRARILLVGLAPGAHGANRTGRMFTGDRSGDFLYAALNRAGMANQPVATSRDDGLRLSGVYITASLRCAPPGNKPTADQLNACRTYLVDEIRILQPRVILCLGGISWNTTLRAMAGLGCEIPTPKPKFGHGCELVLEEAMLLGCYHVSQQNTFTGRLTEAMVDAILKRARQFADGRAG